MRGYIHNSQYAASPSASADPNTPARQARCIMRYAPHAAEADVTRWPLKFPGRLACGGRGHRAAKCVVENGRRAVDDGGCFATHRITAWMGFCWRGRGPCG